MFTTVCPGCDSSLNAPDTLKGKKVKCKKCGEPFVAKPTGDEDEPLPKTVKTPAVERPRPRKSDDEERTEEANKLRAKKRRPADDEDDSEIMEAQLVDDDEEEAPRPKKKKGAGKRRNDKKSPVMLFVLIGVGAVLLLGGGAVGAYLAFFNEEKKTDSSQTKGGNTTGNAGSVAATAGWVDFHEPDGRYRVKFPQAPGAPITQRQPLPNGESLEVKMVPVNLGQEAFLSGHAILPAALADAPPDQILDMATNEESARAKGASIRSRKTITHQGIAGREVVIDFTGKKTPTVMRVFLANGRMILLVAASENVSPDSPRVKTFFESLKIE